MGCQLFPRPILCRGRLHHHAVDLQPVKLVLGPPSRHVPTRLRVALLDVAGPIEVCQAERVIGERP